MFQKNNIVGLRKACIFHMHQQSINLCHMASAVGILIQFIFSSQKCTMGPVSVAAAAAATTAAAAAAARRHLSLERKRVAMNNSIDFFPLACFYCRRLRAVALCFTPLYTHTHTAPRNMHPPCADRRSWLLLTAPCHCQWRHELRVKSC